MRGTAEVGREATDLDVRLVKFERFSSVGNCESVRFELDMRLAYSVSTILVFRPLDSSRGGTQHTWALLQKNDGSRSYLLIAWV